MKITRSRKREAQAARIAVQAALDELAALPGPCRSFVEVFSERLDARYGKSVGDAARKALRGAP